MGFVPSKLASEKCDTMTKPVTRPESCQVDHGRDSAACVVSRRHAVMSHEVCSAGKFGEAGFTNDAAVHHIDTPACRTTAMVRSTRAVQQIMRRDVPFICL